MDEQGGGLFSWLKPDINLICDAPRAFAINTLCILILCFGINYWMFKTNLDLKTDRIEDLSGKMEQVKQERDSLTDQLNEVKSKPIYGDHRYFRSKEMETISRKTFSNEAVEIDGKIFDHVDFINVTLNYRGIGPVSFIESKFHGTFVLQTDNAAAKSYHDLIDYARTRPGVETVVVGEKDESGNIRTVLRYVPTAAKKKSVLFCVTY